MRRSMFAVGLAVSLFAAGSPHAASQPAVGVGCVVVVPATTTPAPVPTTTATAVPPVPCPTEPAITTGPSATATAPTVTTTAPPVVAQAAPTPTVPPAVLQTTTSAPSSVTPTTTIPTTTVPVTTVPVTTVPVTTVPVTTVPTTATPRVAAIAAPAAAPADLLDIVVPSAMTGPSTIVPGATWTGTMGMSVRGVGLNGWKTTVSLSTIVGKNTRRVITPTVATYSAPSSLCSAGITGTSTAINLPLTSTAALAKRGGALCLSSWISTVSIGVPSASVLADTYTATLTHSIF
ncbi:hypothetical protein QMK17_11370 [Rhodococcus sp. G-MC3]|uniref:hypothetical protein n=1 Tax=Rhodococcus sp. G-MC3 TaxID=3046209 RepID=UPI0024BBA0B9|nr:hypothetical protein [Rhodococcus sp. G-MC3]MDJ0393930.1 hypothetical protein [Rhodococcus sp. G-MC3]